MSIVVCVLWLMVWSGITDSVIATIGAACKTEEVVGSAGGCGNFEECEEVNGKLQCVCETDGACPGSQVCRAHQCVGGSGGLSGGAIAGIIIGVLLGIGLVILALLYLLRRRSSAAAYGDASKQGSYVAETQAGFA